MERNTFGAGYRAKARFEVACFPCTQHFLTTSYPQASRIHDQQGLVDAVRAVSEHEA